MKFFENAKITWKSMTKAQKAKMILRVVCDIGSAFLSDVLANKLIDEDEGRVKKLCMKTAMYGLGMAASTAASNELCDMVDIIAPEKKSKKDEEEEDEADV